MKLTNPILTDHTFILWKRVLVRTLRIMAEPRKWVSYISQAIWEFRPLVVRYAWFDARFWKNSKVIPISNYEEIGMLENKIWERMSEYSRVFNIDPAYISLNSGNQAACSSTLSVEKEVYYARYPLVLEEWQVSRVWKRGLQPLSHECGALHTHN